VHGGRLLDDHGMLRVKPPEQLAIEELVVIALRDPHGRELRHRDDVARGLAALERRRRALVEVAGAENEADLLAAREVDAPVVDAHALVEPLVLVEVVIGVREDAKSLGHQ
jgi:hypothetical protein